MIKNLDKIGEIYVERYEVNSKLLQETPKIRDKIDDGIASEPIAIVQEPEL